MVDFGDVLLPPNFKNIGGLATLHYGAPLSSIFWWPVLPNAPTTIPAYVTLIGDLAFNVGKKLAKFYSTLDTGRVVSKYVGETDGHTWEHSFEWIYPGSEDQALGMIARMNEEPMVFIATEAGAVLRMLGSPAFPARMTLADTDTGLKTSDRKHVKIKVESRGMTPCPKYIGALQLTPVITVPIGSPPSPD